MIYIENEKRLLKMNLIQILNFALYRQVKNLLAVFPSKQTSYQYTYYDDTHIQNQSGGNGRINKSAEYVLFEIPSTEIKKIKPTIDNIRI